MGLFEHLDELRSRLIKVVGFLLVALIAISLFVEPIMEYLVEPCGCGQINTLKPTDGILVYFRVALTAAGILVAPYATYHLLMFILPGLKNNERRIVMTALPVTTVLFMAGVLFSWFVLIPTALPFLRDFLGDVLEPEWTADYYIAFITTLVFWMGVAFEMPVIFFVLARVGIIGPSTLIQNWRLAVVVMTIVAAFITPTVDPFNMALVVAPLLLLYVLSIFLAAIAYRRSEVEEA